MFMAEKHDRGTPGRLECSVVTPEASALETTADFIALPLYDGEIGIAPAHSPFIGRLGYGEIAGRRWRPDGALLCRTAVSSKWRNNVVSVLTNYSTPAGQLDSQAARAQLATARAGKANSPELLAERARAELQARAKLRLAEKAGR